MPRCRAIAAVRDIALPSDVAPTWRSSGSRCSAVEQAEQAGAALMRRQRHRLRVAEREHAEPVATPCRDVTDRDRDAVGDVGLAAIAGAELHRRRRVEQEPGDEHALGEVDAHVRLAHARGDVPLHLPHVVAGDVRPNLGELDAVAVLRRSVVAREHALQPAADLDLERAKRLRRQRPRAGTLRRRRAERTARRSRPRQAHLGHGDRREHGVENPVGGDPLCEGGVAQDEAMAERVLRDCASRPRS